MNCGKERFKRGACTVIRIREKEINSCPDMYRRWEMLPALAVLKGKRKLKFRSPENVSVAVQAKGWMDSDLMFRWLRGVTLPYAEVTGP